MATVGDVKMYSNDCMYSYTLYFFRHPKHFHNALLSYSIYAKITVPK